jgi:dihydroxyacetone kinase-like predicted kinase
VIEGGQTMNPSAAELVAAFEAVPSEHVVVLPNNPNVLLSVEQAKSLTSKDVRIVASRSVQAGFAAAYRFLPTNRADENERAMLEALAAVSTGEVTIASRDGQLDGVAIRRGAFLGLVDGAAVASDDAFENVALAVAEHVLSPEHERLDLIAGEDAPPLELVQAAIETAHPDVEVEVRDGGQPHYPLLLVAE